MRLFTTHYDEQAAVHVGYCHLLKIYSQGSSDKEARAAVIDAAKLFLIACYKRGILIRALRARLAACGA